MNTNMYYILCSNTYLIMRQKYLNINGGNTFSKIKYISASLVGLKIEKSLFVFLEYLTICFDLKFCLGRLTLNIHKYQKYIVHCCNSNLKSI